MVGDSNDAGAAMKFAVLLLLTGCCASAAVAQAPLAFQPVVATDPCAAIDPGDLSSCGMESYGDKNYASALKAWSLAAQHGEYQAARWVGEMYAGGKGVKQNDVQAYEWFDIAAALHARRIAKEGPAPSSGVRDSNQDEIDRRNAVAKKMKPNQVKEAQELSRKWQAANPHAIVEQKGFTG
jgi:TPR repeat protein